MSYDSVIITLILLVDLHMAIEQNYRKKLNSIRRKMLKWTLATRRKEWVTRTSRG